MTEKRALQSELSVVPPNSPSLDDRLRGCLVWAAAGDSLGSLTEFPSQSPPYGSADIERLRQKLKPLEGTGRVTRYHARQRALLRGFLRDPCPPGAYTDDTQLALVLAHCLTPGPELDGPRFGKIELPAWLAWERGCGTTTRAACENLAKKRSQWNQNAYTVAAWKIDFRQGDGNGTAMRAAPVGLATSSREQIQRLSFLQALTTHGHPRALIAAWIQALAVRMAFEWPGRVDPQEFASALESELHRSLPKDPSFAEWRRLWNQQGDFDAAYETAIHELSKQVLDLPALLERHKLPGDRGQGLAALFAELGLYGAKKSEAGRSALGALAAFLWEASENSPDGHGLLIDTVNCVGCDTDTLACMAGALVGAWLGESRLPQSFQGVQDQRYLSDLGPRLASLERTKSPPKERGRPAQRWSKPLDPAGLQVGERAWHAVYGGFKVTARLGPSQVGRVSVVQLDADLDLGFSVHFLSHRLAGQVFAEAEGLPGLEGVARGFALAPEGRLLRGDLE